MAEGKEENREKNEGEEESVKLFVGQIPKHMSESQLLTLFQEFAVVDEVNIIKDKITRASRGFLQPSSSSSRRFISHPLFLFLLPLIFWDFSSFKFENVVFDLRDSSRFI